MTVCSYHVTYAFQSESTRYSLTKWLSVRLRTKWLWVQFQLQSHFLLYLVYNNVDSKHAISPDQALR